MSSDRPVRALALFDMDDTLVRGNTAGLYFRDQYRNKRLNRQQMLRIGWVLARYKLNTVDMAALAHVAARHIAGELEAEMRAVCERVYADHVQRLVCPAALRALREHQGRGDVCAILTASTPYIASLLARDLDIAEVLCTELEVADGRFTGRLVGEPCFGPAKVRRAEELAGRHGLPLEHAFFYTDSHSDAPLLERVGHPRVVRPDPRLRLRAWRAGWPVLPW